MLYQYYYYYYCLFSWSLIGSGSCTYAQDVPRHSSSSTAAATAAAAGFVIQAPSGTPPNSVGHSHNHKRMLQGDVSNYKHGKDNKIAPSSSPSISFMPSTAPTDWPSMHPSVSMMPSVLPTDRPSRLPSTSPSVSPTGLPSVSPTDFPSKMPSESPTNEPTVSDYPSRTPSVSPTGEPSISPTPAPTTRTSVDPSRPTLSYCSTTGNSDSTNDENGLIVGYYYGIILKGDGSSVTEALPLLEKSMSSDLLDTLLECESGDRRLQLRSSHRALRATALDSLPTDEVNEKESCVSDEEGTTCVVIDGAITIYTNDGVVNDDAILQAIDNNIKENSYDSSIHSDIVQVAYRGKRIIVFSAAGGDSAGSSASDSNLFDFSGGNVAGAFLLGFLIVAFVTIIVLAVKFDRRRKNRDDDLSERQKEEWFNLDDSQDGAFPVNILQHRSLSYDTSDIVVQSKDSGEFHMGSDADSDGWERSEIPASPERRLSKPTAWDTINNDTFFNEQNADNIEVKVSSPHRFGLPLEKNKSFNPDTVDF